MLAFLSMRKGETMRIQTGYRSVQDQSAKVDLVKKTVIKTLKLIKKRDFHTSYLNLSSKIFKRRRIACKTQKCFK